MSRPAGVDPRITPPRSARPIEKTTHQAPLFSGLLGSKGVAHLRRPFETGYHHNVPIIVNMIPEIYDCLQNPYSYGSKIDRSANFVQSMLNAFLGIDADRIQKQKKRLWNPLVLACSGFACLLELPLFILAEVGAVSKTRVARIKHSRAFAVITGLSATLTLVYTLMSVVVGWDAFAKALSVMFSP